jgi:hypothetical protein
MTTARFIRLGPAPSFAAQTGRAELEHPGHGIGQLRRRALVAALRGVGEATSSARVTASGSSAAQARAAASRSVR